MPERIRVSWVSVPGRSRISDLSFQVFNRTLQSEWFSTRAFQRVGQRDWEADLAFIDGGHEY